MSGTLPTDAFQTLDVTHASPTREHVAQSGKVQAQDTGVQRFGLAGKLAPDRPAAAIKLFAFLMRQRGRFGTFDVVPPIAGYTQGDTTSKVTVDGAHVAGATSISVQGADAPIHEGWIKFANHSKVYMVVASGDTSIEVEPALLAPLVDNEVVIYNEVPFRVSLTTDIQELKFRMGPWADQSIEMKEVY